MSYALARAVKNGQEKDEKRHARGTPINVIRACRGHTLKRSKKRRRRREEKGEEKRKEEEGDQLWWGHVLNLYYEMLTGSRGPASVRRVPHLY
jgi:hypothetical protein